MPLPTPSRGEVGPNAPPPADGVDPRRIIIPENLSEAQVVRGYIGRLIVDLRPGPLHGLFCLRQAVLIACDPSRSRPSHARRCRDQWVPARTRFARSAGMTIAGLTAGRHRVLRLLGIPIPDLA